MGNQVPFSSESHFYTAYRSKLLAMLENDENDSDVGLASFILVCANAYFDGEILAALKDELTTSFIRLKNYYSRFFGFGQVMNERYAEDLLVFLKIALVGLNDLQVTQHRRMDHWSIQFNHLRSFRPQRSAARLVASIDSPFNEFAFHYDLALCERENFWNGMIKGKKTYFLYNKYPFTRYHALIIPEPEKNQRQFLDQENHTWAWDIANTLADQLPGFGMGYNSLGTFASVNHLHFQSFIDPHGLPVSQTHWKHNGGSIEYPVQCEVFDSWEESWRWVETIHKKNTNAYNLLYLKNRIYCFERKKQGTYKHSRWTSGFAWYEVTGNIITFNKDDFTNLTTDQIEKEFKKIEAVN
jgi:hypothetical protein